MHIEPDYFDRHRKDHSHRPLLLMSAIAANAVIWIGLALLISGVL